MKLLIATDGWLPRWDGIVRFLLEIIPRLNCEIRVLAPEFPGEYKPPVAVDTRRFPLLNIQFGDIYFSKVTAHGLKEHVEWADVIFVQSLGTIGMSAIVAGKRSKKPVIAYLHLIEWELSSRSIKRFKPLVSFVTKRLARHYYNKCDCLICPTEEVLHKYESAGIETPKRVAVLGTDTRKFCPPENKKLAKEKVGIPPDKLVIGFTGRIGREKDLFTLYRAFRRIEKSHPEAKLLIVGQGVKELEEQFTSNRNIIMPGFKNNVVPYLQAMDIFVMPSLTETTSLATMEAMSCEVPVIMTPVGLLQEYIIEKKNGMFFPFSNSLVLAMKLQQLLDNEAQRRELGKAGRKTVCDMFSWENTVQNISKYIKEFSGA